MLSIPIPQYCEGGVFLFLDQPINVASDLAFLVVWWLLFVRYSKRKMEWQFTVMLFLVFTTFVASLLWHAHPTAVTSIADRVTPMLFIGFSLYYGLKQLTKATIISMVVGLMYALSLTVLIFLLPSTPINGTIRHSITIGALVLFVGWFQLKKPKFLPELLRVVVLYSVAILFRVLDGIACTIVPVGTHFLWHIFMALTMYHLILLQEKLSVDTTP